MAAVIAAVFSFATLAQSQMPSRAPYTWKSVQIVGGGFVDGIVFHPTAKGVCYCRTDMGGAYRRNEHTMAWEPMLDWVSYEDLNLMGVESIALDPSDPNRIYLACGTYTFPQVPNGAILRSSNCGKSFQRTNLPFKMGGNEDGRGNGERMAVDPNDGNVLYLGTRHAGLWKSVDRALTWSVVENFPDVIEAPPANVQSPDSIRRWQRLNMGSGIIFVLFDHQSGFSGKGSSTLYVGASLINRENLFRSTDAGITWQALPGQPTQYRPTRAVLASGGVMFITYGTSPGPSRMNDGAVWKFNTTNGEWMEITPDKPMPERRKAFGYAAVSVDSHNPRTLIVSSFGRPESAGGDDIFRSTDGGSSWKPIFGGGGTFDFSLAPYVARTPIHWLFDIEIDPADPDHAMFTTGYGGYETFDLSDADAGLPTRWSVMSRGIEETVALDLLSPPQGAHLISSIGDYGGFVHRDLDTPAPEGSFLNPGFGNTTSVACAENNPDVIVRVGRARNDNPGRNIGFSLDGGKTWNPTRTMPGPESRLGSIAVSSDGSIWIWAPDPIQGDPRSGRPPVPTPVYRTTDRGTTWSQCQGIPDNTRVIADRVSALKFYAMDLFGGKIFVSLDGGARFTQQSLTLPSGPVRTNENRGDSRGGQDRIYAAPGTEGDLWIAAFDGLYHSADAGRSFSRIDGVQELHAFGFGKEAPGKSYPALYVVGSLNGLRGIFRSDDVGLTWMRINDDQHQWGLLLQITGDPKRYGRVYIGTHGRGILYGDPQK
jgi:hypothetical protein